MVGVANAEGRANETGGVLAEAVGGVAKENGSDVVGFVVSENGNAAIDA